MKRERIDLRVRVDEKEYFQTSAKKLGLDMSEMIRRGTLYYIETMLNNKSAKSV